MNRKLAHANKKAKEFFQTHWKWLAPVSAVVVTGLVLLILWLTGVLWASSTTTDATPATTPTVPDTKEGTWARQSGADGLSGKTLGQPVAFSGASDASYLALIADNAWQRLQKYTRQLAGATEPYLTSFTTAEQPSVALSDLAGDFTAYTMKGNARFCAVQLSEGAGRASPANSKVLVIPWASWDSENMFAFRTGTAIFGMQVAFDPLVETRVYVGYAKVIGGDTSEGVEQYDFGTAWSQTPTATLAPPSGAEETFGYYFAVGEKCMVVGEGVRFSTLGKVYEYGRADASSAWEYKNLSQTLDFGQQFIHDIWLSADGLKLAVNGTNATDEKSELAIYTRSALETDWILRTSKSIDGGHAASIGWQIAPVFAHDVIIGFIDSTTAQLRVYNVDVTNATWTEVYEDTTQADWYQVAYTTDDSGRWWVAGTYENSGTQLALVRKAAH